MARVLSFIGISVPEPIAGDVRQFQRDIKVKHDWNKTLNIPVHITLIPPFYTEQADTGELDELLGQFAGNCTEFCISTNGFGAFLPRVLYLNIEISPELVEIQNRLEQILTENAFLFPEKSARDYRPHITIGSKSLTKKLFAQAWEEYAYKLHSMSWLNTQFIRYEHSHRMWTPVSRFQLQEKT